MRQCLFCRRCQSVSGKALKSAMPGVKGWTSSSVAQKVVDSASPRVERRPVGTLPLPPGAPGRRVARPGRARGTLSFT
ncbi:hypothetical protein D9M68_806800 [compost metagenome]